MTADSVTTPWAIPLCLEMSLVLRTRRSVISRWRIVTQMGRGRRTSTWPLALRRSKTILTAIQTTPLALLLSKATSPVYSTKPSGLLLCQLMTMALQTSLSATQRWPAALAATLTPWLAISQDRTLPTAAITFTSAQALGLRLATRARPFALASLVSLLHALSRASRVYP